MISAAISVYFTIAPLYILRLFFLHIVYDIFVKFYFYSLSMCIGWFHGIVSVVYYRYMNRPVMSCTGLYDPTTIMNADELNRAQREGWAKLCFYLVSFFYYLYRYGSDMCTVLSCSRFCCL